MAEWGRGGGDILYMINITYRRRRRRRPTIPIIILISISC